MFFSALQNLFFLRSAGASGPAGDADAAAPHAGQRRRLKRKTPAAAEVGGGAASGSAPAEGAAPDAAARGGAASARAARAKGKAKPRAAPDTTAAEPEAAPAKRTNHFNAFIRETLANATFHADQPHRARWGAACALWREQRAPLPPGVTYGCSRCRQSPHGCDRCRPTS